MLDESQVAAVGPNDDRAIRNRARLEIDLFLRHPWILTPVPDADWNRDVSQPKAPRLEHVFERRSRELSLSAQGRDCKEAPTAGYSFEVVRASIHEFDS